jgi:ABC-2 type transport system permease protein
MIGIIARKELKSLFSSPLAWAMLAFVQIILAWIFFSRLETFLQYQGQLSQMPNAPGLTQIVVSPMFGVATIVLLMSVPLFTMRLIAEERRSQTMTFLLSAPVSMTEIVLGKFLALLLFVLLIGGMISVMSLALLFGGKLDFGLLGANLLGLALLSASFIAVGLYVSCLTAQPVVAAIGTLAILLGLWLININATNDPDNLSHLFSLLKHYDNFGKGVIALADAIFFLVFTATFLLLAIRRLDADRLRA